MTYEEVQSMLLSFPNWQLNGNKLTRKFLFKNHYEAISFVNAVAWISHKENHHPYMTVGFKDVLVEYWTHAINGISENDFICLAKVDEILV